jgi:hypothetical protein
VTTLGEVPRRRPILEVGDTHRESPLEIPLERKLETPRDPIVEKLDHILKGKERSGRIPKIHEEFKKAKPPSFDGDIKKGEEVEAWLLGLKKYFRVHDYYENVKARITILNLNGKAPIWWEDLGNVKEFHENELSWKQFEKYFRKKYMSEKCMDGKTKEFYELKLGSSP